MNDSARYVKIVEWSVGDHCYVGSAPGFIYGGCHGNNEKAVFDELCQIVEEVVDVYRRDGRPLPPPTSGRDFVNKALRAILDAMPVRRSKRRRR
jgi:predicted RNase H-like HicB family nuclease